MDHAAAAKTLAEFTIPFAQGLIKLRSAKERGVSVTLTATEATAVIAALILLRRDEQESKP